MFKRLLLAAALVFAPLLSDSETTCNCFCKHSKFYWNFLISESPELATYVGYSNNNGKWTDLSLEAVERREGVLMTFLDRLEELDPHHYDEDDQVDLALLKRDLRLMREGLTYKSGYLAATQISGTFHDIQQVIEMMPTDTVQDYEDIISRFRGVPTLIDQTIVLLEKGLEAKITPPQITLRDVPNQIQRVILHGSHGGPLFAPFTQFPATIPQDEQKRLTEAAQMALEESVLPAYRKYHDYLVSTYIPNARTAIGWSALPNGEAWYAHHVRSETTTNLTPDEIHEIGLAEVARIKGEMEKIVFEVRFEGTLEEFFVHINTDPQFFFNDTEELLTAYREVMKKVYDALPNLFGNITKQPCAILPIPAYAENSAPAAYYMPGSPLTGRSGVFYVNTCDLKARPSWEVEALLLHEAVPGHHLQVSVAQELENIAEFRRHTQYTAYVEGWGLYSEGLGSELGLYRDPYSRFGRLTLEMWRAIRLVVDTGIHAKGWTRERGIEFFAKHVGKSDGEIVNEVDRYIVWPGQALAYKIGELKILEWRKRAQEALGDRFDVRAFHDLILGKGALPLDLLETFVQEWIDLEVNRLADPILRSDAHVEVDAVLL